VSRKDNTLTVRLSMAQPAAAAGSGIQVDQIAKIM
jgi:hypothetical protein